MTAALWATASLERDVTEKVGGLIDRLEKREKKPAKKRKKDELDLDDVWS